MSVTKTGPAVLPSPILSLAPDDTESGVTQAFRDAITRSMVGAGIAAVLVGCYVIRVGNYGSLSGTLIAAVTGLATFFILGMLTQPREPGITPDIFKKTLETRLYFLYADKGVVGSNALAIVGPKVDQIFTNIQDRITALNNEYFQLFGYNSDIILANGNWNRITIELHLAGNKPLIIKVGSTANYNQFIVNVDTCDLTVPLSNVRKAIRRRE
jgi:hypothetical protein